MMRLPELIRSLGLSHDDAHPWGPDTAKLDVGLGEKLADRPKGKLVLVTATHPTPLGEGKTVTAIGLAQGLALLGKKAVATLRQPSLAPVFGKKGGGAGGGACRLEPFDRINLHLTGDLHAVASAHNLLAAVLDNHLNRGTLPGLTPSGVSWRWAMDMSAKALWSLEQGGVYPPKRSSGFDLTAASEIMAILALARNYGDLRSRVGRMVVGWTAEGEPITAEQTRSAGAVTALLRDAFRPNLVQTTEGVPAVVHAGPFANIAHGCSSVLADDIALRLGDFVVTESGFGSDCGAEKFFHIKCLASGESPSVVVLVTTVRALKWQSGAYGTRATAEVLNQLAQPAAAQLEAGAANLAGHLDHLRQYGVPVVVAVNRFPSDREEETAFIREFALRNGAVACENSDGFARGGEGTVALARAVEEASRWQERFRPLYRPPLKATDTLKVLQTKVYGARQIQWSEAAQAALVRFEGAGFGDLPLCVAKTAASFSDQGTLLGRPKDFCMTVSDLRLSAGAGFLYALMGDQSTLPGLPREPAAYRIELTDDGTVTGLA